MRIPVKNGGQGIHVFKLGRLSTTHDFFLRSVYNLYSSIIIFHYTSGCFDSIFLCFSLLVDSFNSNSNSSCDH